MSTAEKAQDGVKVEVARRQLGTALALYLDDQDPVSVHCLACGGGEIADFLAQEVGGVAFAQHALNVHVGMEPRELKALRNKYWNAMKHATTHDGKARSDEELLGSFDDGHNDHVLFIGWFDYAVAVRRLPIEAQVFQAWYFAIYPEKLADDFSADPVVRMFPGVREMTRSRRKQLLRRKVVWARRQKDVMGHPLTDRRKLIMGPSA